MALAPGKIVLNIDHLDPGTTPFVYHTVASARRATRGAASANGVVYDAQCVPITNVPVLGNPYPAYDAGTFILRKPSSLAEESLSTLDVYRVEANPTGDSFGFYIYAPKGLKVSVYKGANLVYTQADITPLTSQELAYIDDENFPQRWFSGIPTNDWAVETGDYYKGLGKLKFSHVSGTENRYRFVVDERVGDTAWRWAISSSPPTTILSCPVPPTVQAYQDYIGVMQFSIKPSVLTKYNSDNSPVTQVNPNLQFTAYGLLPSTVHKLINNRGWGVNGEFAPYIIPDGGYLGQPLKTDEFGRLSFRLIIPQADNQLTDLDTVSDTLDIMEFVGEDWSVVGGSTSKKSFAFSNRFVFEG